jgi:hypothetical protein
LFRCREKAKEERHARVVASVKKQHKASMAEAEGAKEKLVEVAKACSDVKAERKGVLQ